MLRRLELRNFAIIDELGLDLEPGLNVLSGETGAGKSIVIDGLELLAGARADVGHIRAGSESALVQGEFGGPEPFSAARRLAANGRHSARLDGELVTVGELAERCSAHVAVFAQHGALELQTPSAQRAQLDRLLSTADAELMQRYRQDFQRHAKVSALLFEVERAKRERVRRLDVLSFQLEEIEAVAPVADEDQALATELDGLRNAERITKGAARALEALIGDQASATALAADALRELRAVQRHAPSLAPLAADLDAALTGLSAVATEVESFVQNFDADPKRLDAVQARLASLERLKRKYGDGLDEVVRFGEALRVEREQLLALDEDEAELRSEAETLAAALAKAGERLSAARRKAAQRLEREVTPLLRRLGMANAVFSVEVRDAAQPTLAGLDEVTFKFSANPGEEAGVIAQVASGGELSRLMLALHLVTGSDQQTLAFDEIDAGIGGRAAHDVGALLGALATDKQVLVVTHLAQVAAFAGTHYVVDKRQEDGRTVTGVRRLSLQERPHELARMLSGTVTGASLAHAEELLLAARTPA